MITISNITKKFDNETVFSRISFEINKKDKLLIVGPSGSGKTTLVRCLNKFEKPDSGNIYYEGINIKEINDTKLRNEIGMVFQNFNLFPHLTVKENIALAPTLLKLGTKKEINDKVKSLLESVHILDKINEYPRTLSGGEKQRVAIARSLATNPKVIIFDEPTSALDPKAINDLVDLLNELSKKTTIVVVSHDMGFVKSFANKIVFLSDKSIMTFSSPSKLLNSKNIKVKSFLDL